VWSPYTCSTWDKGQIETSLHLFDVCFALDAGSGESGVILLLSRDLGFVWGQAEKSSFHIGTNKRQLEQELDPGKRVVWLRQ